MLKRKSKKMINVYFYVQCETKNLFSKINPLTIFVDGKSYFFIPEKIGYDENMYSEKIKSVTDKNIHKIIVNNNVLDLAIGQKLEKDGYCVSVVDGVEL